MTRRHSLDTLFIPKWAHRASTILLHITAFRIRQGSTHLNVAVAIVRRLLQSLLQSREWECGRHVLQVYVNVAASVAGQRQLLQSPAAAGWLRHTPNDFFGNHSPS